MVREWFVLVNGHKPLTLHILVYHHHHLGGPIYKLNALSKTEERRACKREEFLCYSHSSSFHISSFLLQTPLLLFALLVVIRYAELPHGQQLKSDAMSICCLLYTSRCV